MIIFRDMTWITEYKVEKNNGVTIVTGVFAGSAGQFRVEYQGDGGNADTYHITLWDGQFSYSEDKPMTFTITGCWEFNEVADMFQLVNKIVNRS